MSKFVEIRGDLFEGIEKTEKDVMVVICHCTNDQKIAKSGFIVPLFKRFPEAKEAYFRENTRLGEVSYGWIDSTISNNVPKFYIANMCAQSSIKPYVKKPGKYSALVKCMEDVKYQLDCFKINWDGMSNGLGQILKPAPKIEIHAPRFCSDRAGLNWSFIKELIEEIWGEFDVTVYYL